MEQANPPVELIKLTRKSKMREQEFLCLTDMLALRRAGVVEEPLLGLYAESRAESIFAESTADAPDCLECGACCAYFHQVPVLMTDPTPRALTWAVLEPEDSEDDLEDDHVRWLKREPVGGRCVALDGPVGRQVSCSVYELRPKSCREFERGSDRCHAVRRMYGLEPPLSDNERARHEHWLSRREEDEEALELAKPDLSSGEGRRGFLEELIDYNRGKLAEVVREMERLLEVFKSAGLSEGAARCERARQYVERSMESIAKVIEGDALMRTDLLIELGAASERALERASIRLMRIGEFAFDALGYRAQNARLHTK
jgi:Fe-S-cluster containining protein